MSDQPAVWERLRIEDEIAVHEIKARWCEEHGYPVDAAMHLAHVAQLRCRLNPMESAKEGSTTPLLHSPPKEGR